MKKIIALVLLMLVVLVNGAMAQSDELIAAAQAEGELVVYGSCEEEYLASVTQHFQEHYGIKTT